MTRTEPPLARRLALIGLLLAGCGGPVALGADSSTPTLTIPADVYRDVVFPYYKNALRSSQVEAAQADALGLGEQRSQIKLQGGVKIYVYDTERLAADPAREPPPLKLEVTSREGLYRQQPLASGQLEQLAHLEKDVTVFRYMPAPDGRDVIDTRIFCENATWSQDREVLSGTGPVRMLQVDKTLEGVNYLYDLRRAAPPPEEPGAVHGKKRELGGWFQLEKDVRMEIQRLPAKSPAAPAAPEAGAPPAGVPDATADAANRTVIVCRGIASYNLDTREVHFQDDVVVTHQDLLMKSDFLKALMRPEAKMQAGQPIQTIIAWDNVVIHGRMEREGQAAATGYTARGVYARYDADARELVLADPKLRQVSVVDYGSDEISDLVLRFETASHKLTGQGGQGKALINTRMEGAAEGASPPLPTVISYRRQLVYERLKNYAIFEGEVRGEREGLIINSDRLQVDLTPENERKPGQHHGIERMLAEGKVVIERGEKRAYATSAELDSRRKEIKLFGPPNPRIVEPGSRFVAPRITNIQKGTDAKGNALNLVLATGPGSVEFAAGGTNPAAEPAAAAAPADATGETLDPAADSTTVRYDRDLEYDEAKLYILFRENVVATSKEYVSHSDQLQVLLRAVTGVDAAGVEHTRNEIRLIAASGNATLHWGRRHCQGGQIVRDLAQDTVTVLGTAEKVASVWEEDGNQFFAPKIVTRGNGDRIDAVGPGKLGMPDNAGGQTAVTYTGSAVYSAAEGRQSKAVFRENVVLTRPDLIVTGDEMEAWLEAVDDPAAAAKRTVDTPGEVDAAPRKLKRVVVRGRVTARRGEQISRGEVGELEIKPGGDIVTMHGTRKLPAEVRDGANLNLFAPIVRVWQGTGVIRASGPGEVHVASLESLGGEAVARGQRGRLEQYVINYDGELIYNSLARKIKFLDNVRLSQRDLQGRCDSMTLLLNDEPGLDPNISGKALKVKSVEALGKARFKRFEPARLPEQQRLAPEDRPGKTVYTRSEEAYYDVEQKKILLAGDSPLPEAIQQTTEYDEKNALQRSRVYFSAPKMWLDVERGDITLRGRPQKTNYLSTAGPVLFPTE